MVWQCVTAQCNQYNNCDILSLMWCSIFVYYVQNATVKKEKEKEKKQYPCLQLSYNYLSSTYMYILYIRMYMQRHLSSSCNYFTLLFICHGYFENGSGRLQLECTSIYELYTFNWLLLTTSSKEWVWEALIRMYKHQVYFVAMVTEIGYGRL